MQKYQQSIQRACTVNPLLNGNNTACETQNCQGLNKNTAYVFPDLTLRIKSLGANAVDVAINITVIYFLSLQTSIASVPIILRMYEECKLLQ